MKCVAACVFNDLTRFRLIRRLQKIIFFTEIAFYCKCTVMINGLFPLNAQSKKHINTNEMDCFYMVEISKAFLLNQASIQT